MANPYVIAGKVYDTDGTTILANIKVTARNERTNKLLTCVTNSAGEYAFDASNFEGSYVNGDIVTVFIIYSNSEDYEEHTIDVSAGGISTLDLTLVVVPASGALRYVTVQEFYDYFHLTVGGEGTPLTNEIVAVGILVEDEIDRMCNQKFDTDDGDYYTVTDEYHDAVSKYQADWFLEKTPLISITTFKVNSAEENDTASWTTLTEVANQIKVDKRTGRIRITGDVDDDSTSNYPEPGVKQIKVTYTYGQSTPRDIKKLTILMMAKDLMQGTVARALFRGQDSFKTDHYNVFDTQIKSILSRYRTVDMFNV